jgi:hypothetical protein
MPYYSYLSIVSPAIGLIIGVIYFKKIKLEPSALVIFSLLVISIICDLAGLYFANVYRNNIWVSNIYLLSELFLVSLFYKKNNTSHFWLYCLVLPSILYFLFFLIESGMSTYNRMYYPFNNFIFIFFSIRLFYFMFLREEEMYLEENSIFWFNLAFLVYFSGSFFTELVGNLGEYNRFFQNSFNILKNLLFVVGLWKVRTA